MSSSGLIYAVIVGAWAAYLVPMWLRRQDELNEARPTERFSTAIRLLSGKAAMERRYAKDAERRETGTSASGASEEPDASDGDVADEYAPDAAADPGVDVRAFADPKTMVRAAVPQAHTELHGAPGRGEQRGDGGEHAERGDRDERAQRAKRAERNERAERKAAERTKRAKVLARRRRTTMMLFLAFSFGAIAAAVGGFAFLWAPAVPAALLSAYIAHLRAQERRRFTVTMDRRRAEEAARQLRERRTRAKAVREPEPDPLPTRAEEAPAEPAPSAGQRALVEQTDHAEWVDQERGRVGEQPEGEGWDPVPVPLPTYVSAPVAPRTARGVDLGSADTWSSARSTTAGTPEPRPAPPAAPRRDRGRTPLFDQMADKDRPRAANE